jgi:hypothetical protein
MSEHIFDNDGMVEFDHYVPSAKPDPQVPSLNDFKSFCESTGRHWEEYSGIPLILEFAGWWGKR